MKRIIVIVIAGLGLTLWMWFSEPDTGDAVLDCALKYEIGSQMFCDCLKGKEHDYGF